MLKIEKWRVKQETSTVCTSLQKDFSFCHSSLQLFNILPTQCPYGQGRGLLSKKWTGGGSGAEKWQIVRRTFMDDPILRTNDNRRFILIVMLNNNILCSEVATPQWLNPQCIPCSPR